MATTGTEMGSGQGADAEAGTSPAQQRWVGAGALAVGLVMAWGAAQVPSDAGYAGVGPNFLPWLVSAVLVVCGVGLLRQAFTGGFQAMEAPSGAARGDWRALAWVLAGVLLCAALMTTAGFVLANALGFGLAVRGLRLAEGRAGGGARQTLLDAVTGLAIAAPVYWLFTKLLAINLPGVTGTGWL